MFVAGDGDDDLVEVIASSIDLLACGGRGTSYVAVRVTPSVRKFIAIAAEISAVHRAPAQTTFFGRQSPADGRPQAQITLCGCERRRFVARRINPIPTSIIIHRA
jgi:hypothetical protein